ncbi:ABC transporter substrate-binding protein [Agrobacterium sp. rho-13.3]|uniref:ABC transporter substrate-binding protein n=1 Tax=Agrobacterium sp. rho-13.3 TaxID=3072980 RepID=UPI002A10E8F4|nr:ABC transporter substrate-binding protein [Agrobacterium sp. rho-13.3]MDX8309212.1 ABC transporter substrate-binding protein [Agrobacterium sp. rho-13.3]
MLKLVQKILMGGALAVAVATAGMSPAAAKDKVTLRLNFLLSGVHTIFYYGVEKGFYKDAGIDLVIGEGQGSARTVQSIATNGDTFGIADGGSVISGATRGAPVKSVMGLLNTSPYAISFRADAGVKTIKDIEGKTVAASAGEASLALLPAIWKQNNIDASKVKILNVDGAGKIIAVMQNRADGTMAGLENQVVVLKSKGVEQKVFLFADLGVNTQGLTVVTNSKLIDDNPDLVKRFVQASLKSIEAAKADPDAAVAAAVKVKPTGDPALLKDQLTVSLTLLPSPSNASAPLGEMAAADWQRTLDLMKEYQDIKTDLPADAFFTNTFVTK